MTVPGRVEAACLLLSLTPPVRGIRHARAVAEVAAWIALRAANRGVQVDRGLVEAAALLHDVDKLLPPDDALRRLRHGEGSGRWLERAGHAELAPIVIDHPVTRLGDPAALRRLLDGPPEARIVAYADKRAAQRLGPIDRRFAGWRRRYPSSSVDALRERAGQLERSVCELAGIEPHDVARLRWTAAALRTAQALRP
jgi:HD domain-containing protein